MQIVRAACLATLVAATSAAAAITPAGCLRASGNAASRCLTKYVAAVERCRLRDDTACEDAARAAGGALEGILARPEVSSARSCSAATAIPLGYPSLDDLLFRQPEACTDFGEDLLGLTSDAAAAADVRCRRVVAKEVRRVRQAVVRQFGRRCFVHAFTAGNCNRTQRDRQVARARARAERRILARCGTTVDAGPLLDVVEDHVRHFAQRVYPPNDLGPTADFGPYPVGVKTLDLVDASRTNAAGTGPRPVKVEVYYPSTPAAVAGVPQDVAQVLGIPVAPTPAFRDVARAAGTFPLVLFSHGNLGIRFQSIFLTTHLASHGYVVVSPDHHGNTFVDALLGIVDPASITNRPLDMSFLIDTFLAKTATGGDFFEGAIDPAKIGMSGHSFGGYTTFALTGGTFVLGTFTDARIKAAFPQAPAAFAFADAFFATIGIPTLIVGGSIDETTPFPGDQQRPFDNLPVGASVVGLAQVVGAGHFTFSDFCEVPRNLLSFIGGFDEACEPRHIAWRHAHDIVNFLGLNFFDATLGGDAAALARIAPANLAEIEDLVYQSK